MYLDVIVEFKGDIREDVFFDLLHEDDFEINGIKVDINPITEGKSGNIEDYYNRTKNYNSLNTNGRTEEDIKNHVEKAKKTFGITSTFSKAGYINIDGTMLNFAGVSDGYDQGYRYQDHREINLIFDETYDTNTRYMTEYIDMGNLRLLDDTGFQEV